MQLHVHRNILERFVKKGDHVLEIGAGPGRFTIELARLETRVWVGDISPVQLELHRQKAAEHGFEEAVVERRQVDLLDLSSYEDDSFDAVVAYGGPLSYLFDQAPAGLAEVRRVLKTGGAALFGVMSLWGAIHEFLPGVIALEPNVNRHLIEVADLHPSNYPDVVHRCHMYRASELSELLARCGFVVEAIAASGFLSTVAGDRLDAFRNDEERWSLLCELEIKACHEPGCLDSGTHIIAVGRKPAV